jgi:hypothetical protein
LIHDLSRPSGGVNCHAFDTSVRYPTIDEITRELTHESYIAKVDLKAAYRSIPLSRQSYTLTGLHWKFEGESETTFLFYAKLPFGASMSCNIFQSITESVCRMMAKRSFFVRSYIDDFVCVGNDELSCKLCYEELIRLLESLGLIINWKKVCAPTRCMTF